MSELDLKQTKLRSLIPNRPFPWDWGMCWLNTLARLASLCSRIAHVSFTLYAQLLSRVPLFETPWTEAHQSPLFMEYSTKNAGVGCHFLLQVIFRTQGLNLHLLCLLHCRWIHYPLSCQGGTFYFNVLLYFPFFPTISCLSSPVLNKNIVLPFWTIKKFVSP